MKRRPQRLRHVGSVSSAWLWLSGPEAELRRRVLALWTPGATLHRGGGGALLTLPEPVRWDTRACPGLPLLEVAGRRCSAPVDPVELAQVPGDVLLLAGGRLHSAEPLVSEDPATWLDLDLEPVDVEPLGDPPVPPVVAAAPLALDVRSRLGVGDAGARAVAKLGEALAERGGVPGAAVAGQVGAALGAAVVGGAGLLARLAALFGGGRRAAGGGVAAEGAPAPGALGRWAGRLDAWGRRLGLDATLGRLLGAQHASYLSQMLARFDGGDLLHALKHAIPLSSVPASLDVPSRWLTWLAPREGLSFGGRGGGAGSGISAPGLYELLQRVYERAFTALAEQGRVREAAYVLAELLDDPHRAVTWLEDQGELRLAAEIAEARELDPGLVVALWIRAGERERAAALARMRGAWASAVEHLERRELDALSQSLRLQWARSEAAAGRHAAACAIAWPIAEARSEASGWLDAAIAGGGVGGARALAAKLQLQPESLPALEAPLRALLDDPSPDAPSARRALAEALGTPEEFAARRVLGALARSLVRDAVAAPGPVASPAATAAAKASGDPLRVDLPGLTSVRLSAQVLGRPAPLELRVPFADTGTTAVHDVVPLPRGRLLLALGELGARVVDSTGRPLRVWAHPTHRLVVDPEGARAVLLGRRGELWRLARVEVPEGRLVSWCDAKLDAFADTFDGGLWFVAQGDRVLALDATADGLRSMWSAGSLARADLLGRRDARVLALRWAPDALQVVVPAAGGEVERFHYALPGPSLRDRTSWPLPPDRRVVALTADGGYVALCSDRVEIAGAASVATWATEERPVGPASAEQGVAVGVEGPDGAAVALLSTEGGTGAVLRARLAFDGAARVGVRLHGPQLLCWDDRGRVRVLDLDDGTLTADLRV